MKRGALYATLLFLSLSACGQGNENKQEIQTPALEEEQPQAAKQEAEKESILGIWSSPEERLEFLSNGTFTLAARIPLTGTWVRASGERYVAIANGPFGIDVPMSACVYGDTLVLAGPPGQGYARYGRVNSDGTVATVNGSLVCLQQ